MVSESTEVSPEANPLADRMAGTPAERMQRVRDLKGAINELSVDPDDQKEIIIRETSPRIRKTTVYSMTDGEPIQVPLKLLELVMYKRDPKTGQYAFTATESEAPKFKLGEIKCFLHPEANDRVLLDEIGLANIHCMSAHLGSLYSKRMHALHRHSQEWAMYQEFVEGRKEQEREARQERQLEATLAIANAAGQQVKAPAKTKTEGD